MPRVFSIFLSIIVLILLAILLYQYNSSTVTISKQIDQSAESVRSEGVIVRPEKQLFNAPAQSIRDDLNAESKVKLSVQANDNIEKEAVVTHVNYQSDNGNDDVAVNKRDGTRVDTPVRAVSNAASTAIRRERELHQLIVEKRRSQYALAQKRLLRDTMAAESNAPNSVQSVYFKFGSTTLTDAASSRLQKISRRLKSKPDIEIEIASYVDKTNKRGVKSHNISQLRAQAVKDYFVSSGVEVSRLSTKAYTATDSEKNTGGSMVSSPKQTDYLEIHEK